MGRLLLLSCFMLFTFGLYSQSKVDSLQAEFGRTTIDSVKILILHQLFQEYRYDSLIKAKETIVKAIALSRVTNHEHLLAVGYNQYADFLTSQSNYDSAISNYQKSLELAEEMNYNEELQTALNGIGANYLRKGNFEKALEYKERTIKFAEIKGDQASIATAYKSMGDMYVERAEYTQAMEFYTLASEKFSTLDNIKGTAITLANIGMIQWKMDNFKSAESYFMRSDSLFKKLDFQPGRAFVSLNLGIIYKNRGELDRAIIYYKHAMDSYQKMGDLHNVAMVNYNMGNVYWDKADIGESINYYDKALRIYTETNDSVQMAYSYKALGDGYRELKENRKAESFLKKAIEVSNNIDLDIVAMQAYGSLAELFENDGNFNEAYKNLVAYNGKKDSLYTKEKRELAGEIEAKFQNEQKVKEIELLSTEKNLQQLQLEKRENERNILIALALIILLIAGLLYNQFRVKQTANKKLRELDQMKSNFFANVSHEFRTPLTLIKGPIERLELNPEERLSADNIQMIRQNADRVLTLVNQLLDLSKIDGGSLKLEAQECDVYQFLRAVTSSFNSLAAQRNIDYRVQVPHRELLANFDKDKLEKVVYNLLSNAFKFSDDGALVSIDVTCNEHGLQLLVSDTGKGISEGKLPFIFDRFYQVDSSITKEKVGSGIGLSLSKDLVELMKGKLTVSSELGMGTVFTVHLPIHEIQRKAEESVAVHISEKISIKAANITQPKAFELVKTDKRNLPEILLVEDNEDMRRYIKEYLIKSYKVLESTNGIEGLQKAISKSPDLIISDLMMPKMDGMELCKKLKTDVHTSHIPVIMLTAKAGIDNKLEGLESGADDYLTKPFGGKELLVRAKNLIEQRQKLRALYSNRELSVDPKKITVTSVDQKFLEQVLALLEDKFSDADFGVPQMQDDLAMSKTQLHRKLRALTNEAPGELLRNFRLKRAAQLLAQKADSVTQIAYKVGFNNLSYFAKCFKELYGVAPSSY